MNYPELFYEFCKKFKTSTKQSKGIGIEAELPVVTLKGEVPDFSVIQGLFRYLEAKGFQIQRAPFSNFLVGASQLNVQSSKNFAYSFDTITTDAGFGILEIALAPQQSIYEAERCFMVIVRLLNDYLSGQNCLLLGFGIQPVTPPSKELIMPKERYLFFERFSQNNVIAKPQGTDVHLLTITASTQCHIDITHQEAITAVNVLNALSGLQIALNANSSIWQGSIDTNCKANREFFWEQCYPERINQIGIPPKFITIETYLQYLLEFKPMLLKREPHLLQILNKTTFSDFMHNATPAIGQTLDGKKITVEPCLTDIHYLNTFCYFNARLVPQYGTIESRMCCQQPPGETFAPTALTLGLLENLENAEKLMNRLPWETWKDVRQQAGHKTFDAQVNDQSIVPMLEELVDIAAKGLQKRKRNEEYFLEPLYERIARKKSPADVAIDIFEKHGLDSFLAYYAFKEQTGTYTEPLSILQSVEP